MGFDEADWDGKPIIAILNTWSDLNTCHTHFKKRVEDIKRGVYQAGGFPVEIPVMSLSETYMKPTTMFYRNMLAMEVEEVLRCHPVDGAVLMGGCDKTNPALLMGAISMDIPAIYVSAGPMLSGRYKDQTLGSGSDLWKYWDKRRAGNLCDDAWGAIEDGIARSPGHCMTMGTASTMAISAEAMGMTLPGATSIPAVHSTHDRMAAASGRRIVEMVWEDLKPSDILSAGSFDNAVIAILAAAGSTNAIIHQIAMARRRGVELDIDRFDALSRKTPVLADIRPSGKYLMEDFHDAGGTRALLEKLRNLLDTDARTVTGKTIGEDIAGAEVYDENIIRPLDHPVSDQGSVCVLRGNLAPDGCVIKPAAADAKLLKHTGPAVVFKDYNDMAARIDEPDLDVTADSVIVLQSAGPIGAPGIPEWGMLPIPKKLLAQGVKDIVRISDARMSGTSYGACVLHICPESHLGGPLAFVRDGDSIELDVEGRQLNLLIDDEELAKRKENWTQPEPRYDRGYGKLFSEQVTQANEGCDFVFLHRSASATPDPEIH
jgi:dihydroxy-acid dehydratase